MCLRHETCVSILTAFQGPRLLGYDLDLLHDYVRRKGTKKMVLALRDSEAFDTGLLTDLLSLFKCDHPYLAFI
jgi:origin recognition complex subunit 3